MWPRKSVAKQELVKVEPRVAPVQTRAEIKISPEFMALTGVRASAPIKPFKIPSPPPGTVPSDRPVMAQDIAFNEINVWAQNGVLGYGGGLYGVQQFQGYPYLAELAQRPEYRRGVEIIAKEMTRKWIRLHSKAADEDKNDYIAKLSDAMEKFRVRDVFREANEHDGFFGRGQIYVDTGVGENPKELVTPLIVSKAKIRQGGLRRLKAIEPLWSYPGVYDASDPLHKNFYAPETWWVQSKEIHSSRLLGMVSREVPDLLKPAYLFGGLSLTQMAEPYVNNWLRARQSVSDLMNAFSVMVLSTNVAATMAGGAGTGLIDRVETFNRFRNNRGTFVIDKDTEALANIAAPLGGLDHLQAQAQEHQASVFGIPLVKLFGITPSGLNASSDGEVKTFYDWIHAQQEHVFAAPLRRIIDIIQLSEFGSIDPSITFSFEPLWELTETERATIRKTNAETAAIYVADGTVGNDEERSRLASEDGGLYDGLDLSVMPEPPANALEPTLFPGAKEEGDPDEPQPPGKAEPEPQTGKPEPKPPAPKPADPKAKASKSPS